MVRLRGTQRVNERGHLEVGGVDTCELAQRFGTPLYVMDEALIRQRMREYVKEFGRRWPRGVNVAFAGKAFLCTAMCKIAEQEGLWLDLSSGGELYTAIKAGFPMEKVYLHGNCKTPEELEMALESGVGRVVVDNFDELEMIGRMASERGVKVDIMLRVTPGVEAHTHEYILTGHLDTKFGFQIYAGQAMEAIRRALEGEHLHLVGLHCHIGSQLLSLGAFEAAVKAMVGLMRSAKEEFGWEAEELNLGGGLGIPYLSSEDAPSVADLAEVITGALERELSRNGLKRPVLALEPGRSIVGEAGLTLYRVWAVKTIPNVRTYVMVDGGMSDNPRVQLYGAKYEAIVANKASKEPVRAVAIAGKHCERDILIEEVLLPEVEPGDIIAVPCTGAYHYSMSSNYNRYPRPAVVLVFKGRAEVIVERETYEDLVAKDRLPERLREEAAGEVRGCVL
ncbi:MAG TPA: diaminopimelate decarboxylase [Armatimonadetes bacterium]|nr:diaminopimelate decarboxylase [Armatimonadota bacterium]